MNTKVIFQKELIRLQTFASLADSHGTTKILGHAPINSNNVELPIMSFHFGSEDKSHPLLLITGGVHGVELVGTQIASSLLETFIHMLFWDDCLKDIIKKLRIVFIPMVNPWGIYMGRRSNHQGIDIMRNAPIEATITSRFPLLSGHRISSRLPWYRGPKTDHKESFDLKHDQKNMTLETRLLSEIIHLESNQRPFIFSLDIHSGFGIHDRLWFPYAYTKKPFYHLSEVLLFKELIDETLPSHFYTIEPQSKHYTTHGDIWDYMFLYYRKHHKNGIFLPFTLEIGSWRWIRKNPFQIFSFDGFFNPIKPHRIKRALMRHRPFFDFLTKATYSWNNWAVKSSAKDQAKAKHAAMRLWYNNHNG